MLNPTMDEISTVYKNIKAKTKILAIKLSDDVYHANKCKNANNCWHFNIYKHDKLHTQLI